METSAMSINTTDDLSDNNFVQACLGSADSAKHLEMLLKSRRNLRKIVMLQFVTLGILVFIQLLNEVLRRHYSSILGLVTIGFMAAIFTASYYHLDLQIKFLKAAMTTK
jgi:uncharacterized membrane protein